MKLNKNLHWIIFSIFLTYCAKQTTPTGGPKDTIPPRLIMAIPADQQLNVKGNTLELTFSEQVVLDNIKDQLIVSPSMGKDYETDLKTDRVTIKFSKPFADSTTYSFNFREAVKDITEKNPARNLAIAFSTGTYIDSLSISGQIIDQLKAKPQKDVIVAVEPQNDTFSIFKHTASYFTRTNNNGQFSIRNLKPANYMIYAFNDANKNLIVDSRNEAYGFLSDSIPLTTDTSRIQIGLIRLDTRPLKLTSARPYNTYFNVKVTKNLLDFDISTSDSSDLYYAYGADQANIQIYNTLKDQDSLLVNLSVRDSLLNQLDTAFYIKFTDRDVTPEKFTTEVRDSRLLGHTGTLTTTIRFSKPLKEINFDSLFFKVDSTTTITFTKKDFHYDEPNRTISIRKQIDKNLYKADDTEFSSQATKPDTTKTPPTKINQLYLGKGAFISIENDSSKSQPIELKPEQLQDLGVIIAETETQAPYLLQILDKNYNILQSFQNRNPVTFEDLPPAEYYLRLVIDKNGNGKWDPGNYFKREEPEKVYYWEGETNARELKLKANFELGPNLINPD